MHRAVGRMICKHIPFWLPPGAGGQSTPLFTRLSRRTDPPFPIYRERSKLEIITGTVASIKEATGSARGKLYGSFVRG